jgi:hypothetical protein
VLCPLSRHRGGCRKGAASGGRVACDDRHAESQLHLDNWRNHALAQSSHPIASLMFDYLHGDVAKQLSPANFTDTGSKFNALAMRTQVTF